MPGKPNEIVCEECDGTGVCPDVDNEVVDGCEACEGSGVIVDIPAAPAGGCQPSTPDADVRAWGDQMQSEASRLAEFVRGGVGVDVPYEAAQALIAVEGAVEAWTELRTSDGASRPSPDTTSSSSGGGGERVTLWKPHANGLWQHSTNWTPPRDAYDVGVFERVGDRVTLPEEGKYGRHLNEIVAQVATLPAADQRAAKACAHCGHPLGVHGEDGCSSCSCAFFRVPAPSPETLPEGALEFRAGYRDEDMPPCRTGWYPSIEAIGRGIENPKLPTMTNAQLIDNWGWDDTWIECRPAQRTSEPEALLPESAAAQRERVGVQGEATGGVDRLLAACDLLTNPPVSIYRHAYLPDDRNWVVVVRTGFTDVAAASASSLDAAAGMVADQLDTTREGGGER